jgi:hypothetical protein
MSTVPTFIPLALLQLQELPPAEAEAWRRRIDRHALDCGCRTGAASLLGGLLALVTAGVAWGNAFVRHPVKHSLLAVAFLLTCALAGKAIGLMLARAQLARTLRRLALALEKRH